MSNVNWVAVDATLDPSLETRLGKTVERVFTPQPGLHWRVGSQNRSVRLQRSSFPPAMFDILGRPHHRLFLQRFLKWYSSTSPPYSPLNAGEFNRFSQRQGVRKTKKQTQKSFLIAHLSPHKLCVCSSALRQVSYEYGLAYEPYNKLPPGSSKDCRQSVCFLLSNPQRVSPSAYNWVADCIPKGKRSYSQKEERQTTAIKK